ncbi:hypothetical protein [Tateyamaria sp. SN3-11]|uniref:hypothetical protein n=1 Tax=Tateyamaria sp. SN3-11 TaxID=3092147 RepID=UPI0039ED1118
MKIDQSERALWCAVLHRAIVDATEGAGGTGLSEVHKLRAIERARNLFARPNLDLEVICTLAGYDDDAVIEKAQAKIAEAPSAEELAKSKAKSGAGREATPITYNGKTHTVAEWSDVTGVKETSIRNRLKKNLPLEQVFTNGYLTSKTKIAASKSTDDSKGRVRLDFVDSLETGA